MKKSYQKGSAQVVIIIILIVALLGALGFVFWNNYLNPENDLPVAQAPTAENSDEAEKTSMIDDTIYEVNITLASESELDKLPTYTPTSFKDYMRGLLNDNEPVKSNIDNNCTVTMTYQVTKISQVNIQGGVVPKDVSDGRTCPGGAPILWVLAPSGSWDQVGLNGPVCESENGGLVYREFATTCLDPKTRDEIDNPNGSIESINSN